MEKRIRLTYDLLIGLLQGKEIHLTQEGEHVIIYPPFDGVFLTHQQIQEIQYSSEERVFSMIQKIMESQKVSKL